MSAPFVEETFDFPQPDGTFIAVRGTGDQYRARFETLDGRPLVRNDAGFLVEAPRPARLGFGPRSVQKPVELVSELKVRDSRWEQRRKKTSRPRRRGLVALDIASAPPSRPTVGTFVGLTLLIDFSDSPATIPRSEVENFCNKPGYTGFGNNGSVFDYFRDVSGGILLYTNVVAPYYRAKKPKSYYTNPAKPFGTRAQELIREALRHHIAKGFNFAALTADGQNFIYALNVFYAGPRVNAWSQGLWPHQSSLASRVRLANGRTFADYQITDMGDQLTLGTFCHENGHMVCDFPDLYQYQGSGLGVGSYCLMCYGGNGANAKNPVHVGAYLKNESGWGAAVNATAGATLSLAAGKNDFVIHQRSATEYFILENRQQQGRDVGLPGSGLAIWHVDETASNTKPPQPAHYECALIQADGLGQLESGGNYGDPGDLFSTATSPAFPSPPQVTGAWRNGLPSGLKIAQISAPGPMMSFRVT